jgi:Flp pilus assembly protein TadG
MDRKPSRRVFAANSAQGLIELALILPVLLFLVMGALDIGRAFHMKVVLENAAREGAYFMVYNTVDGKANSFEKAKEAAIFEAENSGINLQPAQIAVSCLQGETVNNNCPGGSDVQVVVTQQMDFIIVQIFSGPLELSGQARMLIP